MFRRKKISNRTIYGNNVNQSDVHIYDEINDHSSASHGTSEVGIPGTSSNTLNKVAVSPNQMFNELHERNDGSYHYINDGIRSAPERNTKQSNKRKMNKFNRMFSSSAAFFSKSNVITHKYHQKLTQRLRKALGRSVGVTIATQLLRLNLITRSNPSI